jgi:tetratricopeptide (TPR) repeat protein
MMSDNASTVSGNDLRDKLVALVGKLASMSKREAAQLLRRHGATVVEKPAADVHWIVVGEGELPVPVNGGADEWLDPATRQSAERGQTEIITETQLWQRLGLVDPQQEIHRLYTPAMLAELVGVPLAVIRRWHRCGLIVPVREVRKLPYFDFQEVATARRLAELLAAGMSPRTIERRLASLARYLPGVERPLAQLSVIIRGKEILLRQGDGLIEPGGQLRFDFEAAETEASSAAETSVESPPDRSLPAVISLEERRESTLPPMSAEAMGRLAGELEDEGNLDAAAEMYRASMVAGGVRPETCFQLAELLYRMGDLSGARERYYMAIELDEDYVEARANLGCVLAETGRRDLAVAAFEGALRYHKDYADVHYHLARALDDLGRLGDAAEHWRAFLELAADSPWAEEARNRLGNP